MSADIEYLVDLECLMCGRLMGSVQVAHEYAPIPYRCLLLRCQVCGGQPMRGEALPVYVGPRIDFRGRPGRPPRLLREHA